MGGKTERGEARATEMGGMTAWLFTLQAKLFPRTDRRKEDITVFTVECGLLRRCTTLINLPATSSPHPLIY
jgi:hypothetical protein